MCVSWVNGSKRWVYIKVTGIEKHSGALLPPDNVMFLLVWCTGRDGWYYNQFYIRFEFPAPDPLHDYVNWDRSLQMEDLELSDGRFIETELTIVKLWDR